MVKTKQSIDKMKICFAASSGGHFEQLMRLHQMMEMSQSYIITEKTKYNINTKGIKTYYMLQINRKEWLFIAKFIINSIKSLFIILKERPDTIISTGVLATLPTALLAKILGKQLIYIESFAKITSGTMTGKLLYKYADRFYIQWESMRDIYPDAIYKGGIY